MLVYDLTDPSQRVLVLNYSVITILLERLFSVLYGLLQVTDALFTFTDF